MSTTKQTDLIAPVSPVAKPLQKALEVASAPETPQSMANLLLRAVESGAGVDVLEKLVMLHERVADRQAAQEFAQAMAMFQSECPPIQKTSEANVSSSGGAGFRYKYAELDEIARTTQPILARHGLSYSWDSTTEGEKVDVTCWLRHVNGHKVSAHFVCPTESKAGMSSQQKHASALTYARRQSLIQVLGLTTCDPDTDGASHETISAKQAGDFERLLTEVDGNRGKFLEFMGVEAMDEIRVGDVRKALNMIEQKRRKNGGGQ